MLRTVVSAAALCVLPAIASAQSPTVYSSSEAAAATVKLCSRGCIITPRAHVVRAALPATSRATAARSGSRDLETLARRQLDALIAEMD